MSKTKLIDILTFGVALFVLGLVTLTFYSSQYQGFPFFSKKIDSNSDDIFLNTRSQTDEQTVIEPYAFLANTCDNIMGLNIDPFNPPGKPPLSDLEDLGVTWLRIEWRANNGDYEPHLKEYSDAGYKILFIVDYHSVGVNSNPDPSMYAVKFEEAVTKWDQYIDAYEIWNEPDLAAEYYVSPSRLADMTKRASNILKLHQSKAKLVTGGGLASGDVSYLNSLISSLGNCDCYDAVAVHPYLQAPDGFSAGWQVGQLRDFYNKYGNAAGDKPLWVTEIGTPDQSKQADYLLKFYQTSFNTGGSDKVFWFAYSDGMVAGYGLKTAGGTLKPAYDAYKQAANNFGACEPSGEEPGPEPSGEPEPSISPPGGEPTPIVCPTELPEENPELCEGVDITEPPNGATLTQSTEFRWCVNAADCDGVKGFISEWFNFFEIIDGKYAKYESTYDGDPHHIYFEFQPQDYTGAVMSAKLTTIYLDGRTCTKTFSWKRGNP